QSRLDLANANLVRYRTLLPKGAITQEDMDEVIAKVESLDAELAQAKAGQSAAQEKVNSGGDSVQAVRAQLQQAEANEREARIALEKDSGGVTPEVRQIMVELERKRWE